MKLIKSRILFINDLPLYITAQTDLYSDDTTIACSADYEFMHKLECDLINSVAEILNWAVTNKLSINVDKTNVMIVTGRRLEWNPNCIFNHLRSLVIMNKWAIFLVLLCWVRSLIATLISLTQHVDKICKVSQRIVLLRKSQFICLLGIKDCYIII